MLCRQIYDFVKKSVFFRKKEKEKRKHYSGAVKGLTVTAVTAKNFHSDHDVYKLHIILLSLWNLFLCGLLWD